MMYAMVKNVVSPARSSVVNLAFLIACGYERTIEMEVPTHHRPRHEVVEGGLVSLDKPHV